MIARHHASTTRYKKSRHKRKGMLLLIVVACILIAGIAMVGMARTSLHLATTSVDAERELQLRWGVISTQLTLLRGAPLLFVRLEEQARAAESKGPFPSNVRSAVLLGGMKYDVMLADENAKVNLNRIYHTRGKIQAQQVASNLSGVAGVRAHLMPEAPSAKLTRDRQQESDQDTDDEQPPPPPAFRHWGQIFDFARSPFIADAFRILPMATTRITCWGRGQVNIARATDDVVEEACRGALGPGVARKVVRDYREDPRKSIRQISRSLQLNSKESTDLNELVTAHSSTFSLWLSVSSPTGNQLWLAVSAPAEEGGQRTERYRY